MIEKEIALKLQVGTIELDNYAQTYIPKTLFDDISKCDFELLKQECIKLGFHIYKANKTPFDKRYYKSKGCFICYLHI